MAERQKFGYEQTLVSAMMCRVCCCRGLIVLEFHTRRRNEVNLHKVTKCDPYVHYLSGIVMLLTATCYPSAGTHELTSTYPYFVP